MNAVASFTVRGRPADAATSALLKASIGAAGISYPGLILIIVTGVWMGFAASLWHYGWIWAGIVVLVVTALAMGAFSRPYHMARDAFAKNDTAAAETRLKQARPVPLAIVGTAAIALLIFLMVMKPF